MMPRCSALPLLTVAGLLLAGCGQSGPPVPTERFVYVSSQDCAAAERVKPEDCIKAVDKAIVEHDKLPLKYPTLADCEKAEGADRCERVVERHWRPRLMAFHFTVKGPSVVAAPLYAGLKGATVFRDAGGSVLDWERTDGVVFSRQSIRKAEGFAPVQRGRRS